MDLFAIFNTHYLSLMIDEDKLGSMVGLHFENVSPGIRSDLKLKLHGD